MTPNVDLHDVIGRALELTSKLDREAALQYFVDSARALTGANFAALGVLDSFGETMQFVQSGLTPEAAKFLGHPPRGHGVIGDIPTDRWLIVEDLPGYENRSEYPDGHPAMRNFLGVIVPVNDEVWGRLYLTDKPEGFTDEDGENMQLLASAASIAVQNSQLYIESTNRSRWLTASNRITASLLEGSDEEEALELITHEMRIAAEADTAMMVLPSIGDVLVSEIVEGDHRQELFGLQFAQSNRIAKVLTDKSGIVVSSLERSGVIPALKHFGPALLAPLISHGMGVGVVILLRNPGKLEFNLHDLAMAESVANQAAIALKLAEARHTKELADQMDQRARISQDLHDLAIQQLFASGMHITAIREDITEEGSPGLTEALDAAISAINDSVGQIRSIVHSLRDEESSIAVVERLHKEASAARRLLGFAPSLVISWNGQNLEPDQLTYIDDAVGSDIADDVVAVVREGLSNTARHAHAASATVDISVTPDEIQVRVIDDGVGLTPAISRRSGLSNMAARARRHRGTFRIYPGDKCGTKFEWKVPLR